MPDPTFKELCQAVVDAGPTGCIWPVNAPTSALLKAMMPAVGDKASPLYDTARAILAAIAEAEERGRREAFGEVVARAEAWLPEPGDDADAAEDVCEWARMRTQGGAS